MTEIELALLRTVVRRPIQPRTPETLAVIERLSDGGYIQFEPSGWVATERGCAEVERMRLSHQK